MQRQHPRRRNKPGMVYTPMPIINSFSFIPFHVFRKNNCTCHHKSSVVEEKRKMARQLFLIPQFRNFLKIYELSNWWRSSLCGLKFSRVHCDDSVTSRKGVKVFWISRRICRLLPRDRWRSRPDKIPSYGPANMCAYITGLSKKMDGIWNRYKLKSTGRI